MRAEKKSVSKKHFEQAIDRVRPTITPDMLEYYSKLEAMLTSGLESIRRKSDTLMGIESVRGECKCRPPSLQNYLAEEL